MISTVVDENSDERLIAEAIQLGEGWMHINGVCTSSDYSPYFCTHAMSLDDRNLPELGRISSPDDIIGSVRVEGGQVSKGAFWLPDNTSSLFLTYTLNSRCSLEHTIECLHIVSALQMV